MEAGRRRGEEAEVRRGEGLGGGEREGGRGRVGGKRQR